MRAVQDCMLSAEVFVDPSEPGGPCELSQQPRDHYTMQKLRKECAYINVSPLGFAHAFLVATRRHPMLYLGT